MPFLPEQRPFRMQKSHPVIKFCESVKQKGSVMKNLIVMKSFQNGISIYMDAEAEFKDILAETADKFQNARAFFRDVK